MKAFALMMFGSLLVAATACHIDVDDHCDDGDHDWDDDDDGQPCATHVHADATATGTRGADGAAGTSASGSGSGGDASGVGGAAGSSTGSGGDAGAGAAHAGSGGSDSGGSDSGGSGSGGSDSGGSDGAGPGSTAGSACTECGELPGGSACLWGTTTMDSCCSVEVLVDVAASECDAYGLALADYRLEVACSAGHEQVNYQCCLADSGSCEANSITLESCVSESILATMAQQLCEEIGSSAMQLTPAEPCGNGSYRSAEFACCPAG